MFNGEPNTKKSQALKKAIIACAAYCIFFPLKTFLHTSNF